MCMEEKAAGRRRVGDGGFGDAGCPSGEFLFAVLRGSRVNERKLSA
jgi:hypothetical protein